MLFAEYHEIQNFLVWGCPLCNIKPSPGFRNHIPYILESNPHPFYSLRAKKSDEDYNRVRIRFAVESWILEK